MHPPFFVPETHILRDVATHHDVKPTIRRGHQPKVLRLLPFATWPPIHPALQDHVDDPVPSLPTGRPAPDRPMLHVVPVPRRTLREVIGRFLIRTGQRMILENRPG